MTSDEYDHFRGLPARIELDPAGWPRPIVGRITFKGSTGESRQRMPSGVFTVSGSMKLYLVDQDALRNGVRAALAELAARRLIYSALRGRLSQL